MYKPSFPVTSLVYSNSDDDYAIADDDDYDHDDDDDCLLMHVLFSGHAM